MSQPYGYGQLSDPAHQAGQWAAPGGEMQPSAHQYAPAPQGPWSGQPAAPQYAVPQYPGVPYGAPVVRSNVSSAHVIIAWIFAVGTFGYMLPWAIAATRGKSNAGAIAVLNFFLGWTMIGWIVALVMACGAEQAAVGGTIVNVSQSVAVASPSYAPPPAPAPQVDAAAQIGKLAEMRAAGHLTDEEFTAAKARLLA